jgi:hypothetical protein
MTTIQEIEAAIRQLSPRELVDFRSWFLEFDAAVWDRQIEADVAAGRFEKFAEEALQDLREGQTTDL